MSRLPGLKLQAWIATIEAYDYSNRWTRLDTLGASTLGIFWAAMAIGSLI
jgi:hypothetical protein